MPTFQTIAAPIFVEIPRIKGSRFLAAAARVRDRASADAFVADVQQAHEAATHSAFAWRLSDGEERQGDDGEVRGTAGAPILQHIVGADLVDIAMVVTRYYGGTLLGRGGLVRAYGGAAAAAIAAAEVIEEVEQAVFKLECSYRLLGPLEGTVQRHGGVLSDPAHGASVTVTVSVPVEHEAALRAELLEQSAGRAILS